MSSRNYMNGKLIEEWDDETRRYKRWNLDGDLIEDLSYEEKAVADGFDPDVYNNEANYRVETSARGISLEARVKSLEDWRASLEKVPEDPTNPEDPDIKSWEDWDGVWPNDTLLSDDGVVWKNVSGGPLTARPTDFPGDPTFWTHLFIQTTSVPDPEPDPEPDPTMPAGYVGTWSKDVTYSKGNVVDKDDHYWRCEIPHGPEQQGLWAPGLAPTVWTDLGLV